MIKSTKFKVSVVILALALIVAFIYQKNQKTELTIGIFAGSNWDVPSFDYYKMIDSAIARFEKSHPNAEVKYKSGIDRKSVV